MLASNLAKRHKLWLFPANADKTPAIQGGFKSASDSPEILERMFRPGTPRLGLWPGPSGLVVVDIDVKDGAQGEEQWAEITKGKDIEAPEVLTPSGGRHLYFRKPKGLVINNTKLAESIDIRSDGGYVIIPSPDSGYEWEVGYPHWCKECGYDHHLLSAAPRFPQFLIDERRTQQERQTEAQSDTDPIPAGARQDTLFRAGMAMRARGVPLGGIEVAIREMNTARCTPPLSDYRIKDLMRGIKDQHMDYPFQPPPVRRRRVVEAEVVPLNWSETFAKENERVGWLPALEGLAIEGRITNLHGPAGVGKSELVLHQAAEAGQHGVRVLWLDREMTEEDAKERLEDMNFKPEDLSNLIYFLYPPLPWLDTAEGGDDLVEMAQQYDAHLVVLDSLSKFVKGDEQHSDTATSFYVHSMLALKEAGIASITIDHTGKDVSKGARGTSAKKDNVDLYMEITRITGVGARLTTGKQRHSWVKPSYIYRRMTDPIRYSLNLLCTHCGAPAVKQVGGMRFCENHLHLTHDGSSASVTTNENIQRAIDLLEGGE